MGENTKIPWCDRAFNPWRGCEQISSGCDNCYAEAMAKRNPAVLGEWGRGTNRVIASDHYWKQPVKWNKIAAFEKKRAKVFCGSMMDVFEDRPDLEQPRARLFDLISQCTELDWLLLTKRPNGIEPIMQKLYCSPGGLWEDQECWEDPITLPNVWLGATTEDQEMADTRTYGLLSVPATKRFLSCEPLLGPVLLGDHLRIDWVIIGCESGPKRRMCKLEWVRSLVEQCDSSGIPVFVKQLDIDGRVSTNVDVWPAWARRQEFPK